MSSISLLQGNVTTKINSRFHLVSHPRDSELKLDMGDRLVGRFTESALLARAKEVVEEKSKASSIFDEEAENALPRFKRSGACP